MKEKTYRIQEIPSINSILDYNGVVIKEKYNDSVSEAHRKKENYQVLRRIVGEFKKMSKEAENGFSGLSKIEQMDFVSNRKRQTRNYLHDGSFFRKEQIQLRNKIDEKTDSIYKSHMKLVKKINF